MEAVSQTSTRVAEDYATGETKKRRIECCATAFPNNITSDKSDRYSHFPDVQDARPLQSWTAPCRRFDHRATSAPLQPISFSSWSQSSKSRSQRGSQKLAPNTLDVEQLCDIFERRYAIKLPFCDYGSFRGTLKLIQTETHILEDTYPPLVLAFVALTVSSYDWIETPRQSPAEYSQRFADAATMAILGATGVFGSVFTIHQIQAALMLMLREIEKEGHTQTGERNTNMLLTLFWIARAGMDLIRWSSDKKKGTIPYETTYHTCETFYILQKDLVTLVGGQVEVQLPPRHKTILGEEYKQGL